MLNLPTLLLVTQLLLFLPSGVDAARRLVIFAGPHETHSTEFIEVSVVDDVEMGTTMDPFFF